MIVPPIAIAALASLGFSCIDASIGYLTNVEEISIVQTILVRTVSHPHPDRLLASSHAVREQPSSSACLISSTSGRKTLHLAHRA